MTEGEIFRQLNKQLEKMLKFEARIAPLIIADSEQGDVAVS